MDESRMEVLEAKVTRVRLSGIAIGTQIGFALGGLRSHHQRRNPRDRAERMGLKASVGTPRRARSVVLTAGIAAGLRGAPQAASRVPAVTLAAFLTAEGHETVAVHTARGGLARIEDGSFDVVLDIGLPDMSGIDLAHIVTIPRRCPTATFRTVLAFSSNQCGPPDSMKRVAFRLCETLRLNKQQTRGDDPASSFRFDGEDLRSVVSVDKRDPSVVRERRPADRTRVLRALPSQWRAAGSNGRRPRSAHTMEAGRVWVSGGQ